MPLSLDTIDYDTEKLIENAVALLLAPYTVYTQQYFGLVESPYIAVKAEQGQSLERFQFINGQKINCNYEMRLSLYVATNRRTSEPGNTQYQQHATIKSYVRKQLNPFVTKNAEWKTSKINDHLSGYYVYDVKYTGTSIGTDDAEDYDTTTLDFALKIALITT